MKRYPVMILVILLSVTAVYGGAQEEYTKLMKEYQSVKTAGDRREMAAKFQKFSDRRDVGILKANAYYWEGECLYDLTDYPQALMSFERALTVLDSYKERDARYMVILCYSKLGWTEGMKWEIERYTADYPNDKGIALLQKLLK